jgi:hypothetical protein
MRKNPVAAVRVLVCNMSYIEHSSIGKRTTNHHQKKRENGNVLPRRDVTVVVSGVCAVVGYGALHH